MFCIVSYFSISFPSLSFPLSTSIVFPFYSYFSLIHLFSASFISFCSMFYSISLSSFCPYLQFLFIFLLFVYLFFFSYSCFSLFSPPVFSSVQDAVLVSLIFSFSLSLFPIFVLFYCPSSVPCHSSISLVFFSARSNIGDD